MKDRMITDLCTGIGMGEETKMIVNRSKISEFISGDESVLPLLLSEAGVRKIDIMDGRPCRLENSDIKSY